MCIVEMEQAWKDINMVAKSVAWSKKREICWVPSPHSDRKNPTWRRRRRRAWSLTFTHVFLLLLGLIDYERKNN